MQIYEAVGTVCIQTITGARLSQLKFADVLGKVRLLQLIQKHGSHPKEIKSLF